MKEEQLSDDASEKADMKFHCIIAEAAQNTALSGIINWLWQLRNQSVLSTSFLERIREEGVHPAIDDHQRILDALAERNPDKAKRAMKRHIRKATKAAANHFKA